ncbi:MAG: hypothetical protein IPI38_01380 [Gemmatimonadetes bacterium]|nr:hypothetical protein [Gemmatimonadota bacterium]MBK7714077.1 hypothetical protein [Gemmatimonadota bacterium]MBK7924080.1 hypothetical protein [Gemmatimonadota bacterium]MBK9068817.1 hypothetical protein [Gemmatimonadota bacterium]
MPELLHDDGETRHEETRRALAQAHTRCVHAKDARTLSLESQEDPREGQQDGADHHRVG